MVYFHLVWNPLLTVPFEIFSPHHSCLSGVLHFLLLDPDRQWVSQWRPCFPPEWCSLWCEGVGRPAGPWLPALTLILVPPSLGGGVSASPLEPRAAWLRYPRPGPPGPQCQPTHCFMFLTSGKVCLFLCLPILRFFPLSLFFRGGVGKECFSKHWFPDPSLSGVPASMWELRMWI